MRFSLEFLIRELREPEYPLLRDFTYEAIFQRDETNLLPRSVLDDPQLRACYEDFGRKDDFCLVAQVEGKIVGAVWTRVIAGAVKGFGNIDEKTPEFAIALRKPCRGAGIGTALMRAMLALLREKGYPRASLSVQKDNYAVRLYEKVGFRTVRETEEEFIMVCDL